MATARPKEAYRQLDSTVPTELLGSCTKCGRLVLVYGFGALRQTFSLDPTGLDRVSIRDHLGVHQVDRQVDRQGFGPGQGTIHFCLDRHSHPRERSLT